MRALKILMALFASGVGLGALVVFTVLDPTAAMAPTQVPEIVAEPESVAEPTAAAPAGVQAAAPAEPVVQEAPSVPEVVEPPTGIAVPDFSDMTALRAYRRARELGLRLDIRDANGERVPSEERPFMRTERTGQTPAAGTMLEAGETVRVRARYPRSGYASGY